MPASAEGLAAAAGPKHLAGSSLFVLPKHLDEKVAALHLTKLGANLTTLRQNQADYIGVKMDGPHKPEAYRY